MAFSDPLEFGADWPQARAIMIFMHGRDQSRDDMRDLAAAIASDGVRILFPRAENGSWLPQSFLAPIEENQPELGEALAHYGAILASICSRGVGLDRIVLGGFAEGACLTAEFLVRNPRSYGGAVILRGGLIDISAIGRRPGSGLLAVPVYVSGSEASPEMPVDRVRGAIKTLQAGGALIRSHIFTDRAHGVSADEIFEIRKLLDEVQQAAEPLA